MNVLADGTTGHDAVGFAGQAGRSERVETLLNSCSSPDEERTKVAVCVIVRDEQRDVAEWLAYQRAVGFDAVIAYDNRSEDATPLILRRAADVFDVRPIFWDRSDARSQFAAYEDCLTRYGSEFEWIAFLDSDEYIVPHKHDDISAMLAEYPSETAIVAVHWAVFGSSGLVDYPSDLLIESFLRRAPAEFGPNGHVKSIVRPRLVSGPLNPHIFETTGAVILADGTPIGRWHVPGVTQMPATHMVCQINHYYVRSREHWERKVARGRFNGSGRTWEDFTYNDRNDIEDQSALRFVRSVHVTMRAIASAAGADASVFRPRRAPVPPTAGERPILHKERLPLCSSLAQLRSIPFGTFVAYEATPIRLPRPVVTFAGDPSRAKSTLPNFLDFQNPGELFPLRSPGHDVHLSRLPSAYCVAGGIILDQDGCIFGESFRHIERRSFRTNVCARGELFSVETMPLRVSYVDGPCLFLDGEHSNAFGHLLAEVATRLWIAKAMKLDGFRIVCGAAPAHILLPMLEPFGISADRLVVNDGVVQCEDLWVASQGAIVRKSVSTAARSVWRAMAEYHAGPSPIDVRNIYVARRRGRFQRELLEEERVERAFARRGFAVIGPEEMSFPDQIRLFANAERVVGCSGSGMFNIVFGGSEQRQMLLTSDAYIVHNEPVLTRSRRPLHYVVGIANDISDPHSNWSLPHDTLEAAIDEWLD